MKLSRIAIASIFVAFSVHAQQASMTFFVTSVGKGNGADLGGLEGADAHCLALAKAAGSTYTNWRAYLSTTLPAGGPGGKARGRIRQSPWGKPQGGAGGQSGGGLHFPGKNNSQPNPLTEKG